jgi:Transposase DDE domain
VGAGAKAETPTVRQPTPHRLLRYLTRGLRLKRYLESPGDSRRFPQIPAKAMLWAILLGQILRESSFHALERLVGSARRRSLGVSRKFGDDALGYFTERLDPTPTRQAAIQIVRQAKRNKAFQDSPFLGLALDGTTVGRCRQQQCCRCRPWRRAASAPIAGYRHHLVMLSVVGTGLSLPIDVEPFGPGDSEYAAGQRLLRRVIPQLGSRFADYLVVDGEFATAPFLHACDDLGLPVMARLKGNLPQLYQAARKRFSQQSAKRSFRWGTDRVAVWDADDFDPWESLRWPTVRVLYYRQHKPDGTVIEAYWLTNLSGQRVSPRSLFRMAKSRWEIENQGFNEAKNQHALEHIPHHHHNSLLIGWLLNALALTIERLYRLRYLHRGSHPRLSAIELCRLLWLNLATCLPPNTS